MKIKKNISLRDKNWFGTGGSAQFYCEPQTAEELRKALAYAYTDNLKTELLGLGANVLISDKGFNGLLIKPQINTIFAIDDSCITFGAGVTIENAINWCLENNFLGLEEFSGIPGTIGGAVYINLHYFSFFLSDFLVSAEVINKKTGAIKSVDQNWFCFGYDQSTLQTKEWVLVSATLKLQQSSNLESAYAKGRRDEIIRQRNSRYPSSNTCGSFFRNFHKSELTLTSPTAKKLPFVAYYLDKLGVKGELSVGGATVSYKHANMLVTADGATSSDIINLARKLQELVFDNFGLIPQAECQLIGFNEHPLHKDLLSLKSRPVKSFLDSHPLSES